MEVFVGMVANTKFPHRCDNACHLCRVLCSFISANAASHIARCKGGAMVHLFRIGKNCPIHGIADYWR